MGFDHRLQIKTNKTKKNVHKGRITYLRTSGSSNFLRFWAWRTRAFQQMVRTAVMTWLLVRRLLILMG